MGKASRPNPNAAKLRNAADTLMDALIYRYHQRRKRDQFYFATEVIGKRLDIVIMDEQAIEGSRAKRLARVLARHFQAELSEDAYHCAPQVTITLEEDEVAADILSNIRLMCWAHQCRPAYSLAEFLWAMPDSIYHVWEQGGDQ